MPTKNLGAADYSAYRFGNVTTLVAKGEFGNFNDKADFEQLPFLISPPMYAFYIISADVGLPALKPFVYEEIVSYPSNAESIRVQDANGFHDVPISGIVAPDFIVSADNQEKTGDFCVYRGFGINPYMVARCGNSVPSFYEQVFGPDTYEKCQEYAKASGGI